MSSHCDFRPKSVDAKNHRYFPPASNTGHVASARPSMTSLYSPDLSLKYDTNFPSGDHAGSRSADPLEFDRLRTSPFSAGIVKISPRDSTTARLPVGERPRFDMRAVTSSHRGIIHGKSPLAVMATTLSLPDFGSSS